MIDPIIDENTMLKYVTVRFCHYSPCLQSYLNYFRTRYILSPANKPKNFEFKSQCNDKY